MTGPDLTLRDDVCPPGIITTVSGRRIDLLDPASFVHNIVIEDVATGLSNTCRWAGQIRKFWSVAQHSIIVSHLCPPAQALHGLLHDRSEAYICDVSAPLKRLPEMAGYKRVEDRLMRASGMAFGVPPHKTPDIDAADLRAMLHEIALFERTILPGTPPGLLLRPEDLPGCSDPLPLLMWPMDPPIAASAFLSRYWQLQRESGRLAA